LNDKFDKHLNNESPTEQIKKRSRENAEVKKRSKAIIVAEEALRSNQRKLMDIIDFLPDATIAIDTKGQIIISNKATEKMTGVPAVEMIGKGDYAYSIPFYGVAKPRLMDLVFLDDGEIATRYSDLTREGEAITAVVFCPALYNKKGAWIFAKASPLHDQTGKVIGAIEIVRDITERKLLENALVNEKKLLETTLKSLGDGVISTDNNGNIVFLNHMGESLTGWTQEEAKGKEIEEVFNVVDELTGKKRDNLVTKVLENKKTIELANHNLLISKDGTQRSIEHGAAPILEESNEILGVVVVFRDFSEKKQKEEEIIYLSYHDYLTGIYNRRFYEDALIRLDTPENLPLTLIMGDVNGLKLINDSFGHLMGDKLIQKVAKTLTKGCRDEDIVVRLGGDEFVVILPRTDVFEAVEITERLKSLTSKEKIGVFDISLSLGFETKENEEEDIQEIFTRAEDYMYRHKQYESASTRSKTIDLILNTLYEKSPQEMLHSKKVSELCAAIAEKMHFTQEEVKQMGFAGLMHDIGKMVIDEKIINKPEKLNPEEWKEMQRHSEIGFRILSSVSEFSEIATYILQHHERWNGGGFPKGLRGEEIIMQARMISIAEVYAELTTARAYRHVLSEEDAIAEIKRCSGTQFDPDVTRVFIEKVMGYKW